jgi:transcriptional regulator with XRE-family HTH domain
MDIVLRLREARRVAGLSQSQAAEASGIGEKTISSFETGQRVGSLKLSQLMRLCRAYGMTIDQFLDGDFEERLVDIGAQEEIDSDVRLKRTLARMVDLDESYREKLIAYFNTMIDRAEHSSRRGRRIV